MDSTGTEAVLCALARDQQCEPSIVRRLFLDMIDDEDGFGALVHLQFQPELLVNRVEQGDRAIGV